MLDTVSGTLTPRDQPTSRVPAPHEVDRVVIDVAVDLSITVIRVRSGARGGLAGFRFVVGPADYEAEPGEPARAPDRSLLTVVLRSTATSITTRSIRAARDSAGGWSRGVKVPAHRVQHGSAAGVAAAVGLPRPGYELVQWLDADRVAVFAYAVRDGGGSEVNDRGDILVCQFSTGTCRLAVRGNRHTAFAVPMAE